MDDTLRKLFGAGDRDLDRVRALVRQRGFAVSTTMFILAAAMLVASIFFPYWHMRLNAPQYPQGLFLTVYIDHIEGDIAEIDGLNHYIGMAPLRDAARLERELAPTAMLVIVLLIVGTAFVHRKWFAPLTLPAMFLPLIFLGDMYFWLRRFGQGLDPGAALSSAIKPFTPTLLGHGAIGQFSTDAAVKGGFWLATTASVLILFGLHFRRQARLAAERELSSTEAAAA
jgi:hypothetical protein